MTDVLATMTGGARCGGSARWSKVDWWHRCGCTIIEESASGGAKCGGSAVPVGPWLVVTSGGAKCGGTASGIIDRVSGGAKCGGSAVPDTVADPYDGYAALYPLDDTATPWLDHSRQALNGTSAYPPTLDVGAGCQHSQKFAARQFINLPNDPIRPAEPFSVSLWMLVEDSWSTTVAWSRGNAWVGKSYFGTLLCGVLGASGTEYDIFGTTTLQQGRWWHVGLVWDGTQVLAYLNGILEGSTQTQETALAAVSGCQIGARANGGCWTGDVMEVRLFGGIRSPAWFAAEAANLCAPGFLTLGY